MTSRLFIALKLPENYVREITEHRQRAWKDDRKLRWEPDEKLHLTLKFLGDTEDKLLPGIESTLESLVLKYAPFSCEFEHFGFFLPRILWIGLKMDGQIFDLVKRLNSDLQNYGFEPERRNFKPHITLLRIKSEPDPEFVEVYKNYRLPAHKFKADEITLFKSELRPQGSIYTEIKSIYLK
ncbi:MAG: RNA 2',3'-cyclic phosphodiesterase [Syntrophothermus sp.]